MSGSPSFPMAAAPWLLEIGLRATIVLAVSFAVVRAFARASAARRHAVLVLAAGALLALPFLSLLLPAWELPVLGRVSAEPPVDVVPRLQVSMPRSRPLPNAREARLNPHLLAPAAAATAVPATATAPSVWPPSLYALAIVLWLAGAAVALARLAVGAVVVRRVARRAALVTDDGWHAVLERCAREIGLARLPLLLQSPAVTAAIVFGHRRPVVVLAADADAWPYEQRRAFLLHELAHARRRDVATRTLAEVARAFYWPHPLAWWLVRRQSTEAERACDDRVLDSGVAADDYADYLLGAARALSALPQPLSVLSVTGRLESRMLAILDPHQRRSPLSGRAWAAGAAVSLAFLASAAAVEPVAATRKKAPAVALPPVPPHVARAPRPATAPVLADGVPRPPAPPAAPAAPSADVAPPVAPAPALAPVAPSADTDPALPPPPPPPAALARPAEAPEAVIAPPPPAALPAPPAPPAPPATVIRISTNLVQLDAVVTDRAGRPVTDLTPADFEVVEGGRHRQVTHVTFVRPSEHAGDVLGRRTLVFLVDDLHLGQRGIHEARAMLSRFARTALAPSDLVTVTKASDVVRRGLQFASGASAVEAAAGAIRYSRESLAEDAIQVRVVHDSSSDGLQRGASAPAGDELAERVRPWVTPQSDTLEASRMAARSVVALKAVVEALRGVPGRKAVVFVSEGFVAELPEGTDAAGRFRRDTFGALDGVYGDTTVRAAIRGVSDLANRASVVVYGIDPTGPASAARATDTGTDAMNGGSADAPSLETFTSAAIGGGRRRETRQNGLLDLAVPTGGLVWRDTFNVDGGLSRILADQSGYYLVAYEPDAATFARIGGAAPFHDLEVTVRRGGLKVRSRKGFYGVTDETVAQELPAM